MPDKTPSLDSAYSLQTPEDNRRLYDDWAETYDTDFASGMDYRIHHHVAGHFATAGGGGPVLDIGAGTGLLGLALAAAGVAQIHGTDISAKMLEVARRKSVYDMLFVGDLTQTLPVVAGSYSGAVSSGAFTHGHLGPEVLDEVLRVVKSGGLIAISINAAHYKGRGFEAKIESIKGRIAELCLHEVAIYGPNAMGDHAADTAYVAVFRKL